MLNKLHILDKNILKQILCLTIIILIILYVFNNIKIENFIADLNKFPYLLNPSEFENPKCSYLCCPTTWDSLRHGYDDINKINPEDIGTKYLTSNTYCSNGFTEGCKCINNQL